MSAHILQPSNNHTLRYFYSQIAQQKRILQAVQQVLPAHLAEHTQHALIREQKLLLYTDAAVWASQLRFYNKAILDSVVQIAPLVQTLQIKVLTEAIGAHEKQAGHKANIPSAEIINEIKQQSQYITDEDLQRALQKLGETLQRFVDNN